METEVGAVDSKQGVDCCGSSGSRGWLPPALAADTPLKRTVDKVLPRTGMAFVAYFAVVVGLLVLAPRFPAREHLAVDGLAALAAGGWCGLNYWRSRHGHCLVTGPGWLILSLLTFAEAAVGRSLIQGDEQLVFVGVLVVGCTFECAWYVARGTNALVPESRMVPGGRVGRWGDQ
jgi:hypothetical protein